jgi:hypothetical protein
VVGDQTLEYMADQPASLMVCSKGYLFEKCGDHETAMRIFDRCIEAGYIGAMIWKALMLQDGALGKPDLPAAAALMRRAAEAGDSPYATLGKLHYASALHEGKPRTWRRRAPGSRPRRRRATPMPSSSCGPATTWGPGWSGPWVGTVPPVAGAMPLPGVLLEEAAAPGRPPPMATPSPAPMARRLVVAPPAVPVTPAVPLPPQRVMGQRLLPPPRVAAPTWTQPAVLSALLLTLVLGGALRQQRRRPPFFPMESDP